MTDQRINLVGIGPGSPGTLTINARDCLKESDVIVGYEKYLDLIDPVIGSNDVERKEFPIGDEEERALHSIDQYREGRTVSLVSSGDAGIYGMGAALFEVIERENVTDVGLNILPGVTALSAASSLLGVPLGQDFASISLSDLLTPWETIRKRIEHAAKGDFVVVFYNPKSSNRTHQIREAFEVLRDHRGSETPVGLVRQAYRSEQSRTVTSIDEINFDQVDMLTTVIVGNSETRVHGDWMYTPRGYLSTVTER